ncbi:hypothetical protein O181_086549 [Austropuccinia psidii MF-1]|uniref:Uncharacterized protein n=1 Tax=Austropuccinia psidii MF-1 TaxID=1389203 RepID=A0A9Q3INE5_9BASI|nr:hypothetical protein [Austropuccinia psidii MF-1]
MNPIAFPSSAKLLSKAWNTMFGHPSDCMIRAFLKAWVPLFHLRTWSPFAYETCTKAKISHSAINQMTKIQSDEPLDLLVSDILCPLGFYPLAPGYIITLQDHALTYTMVSPILTKAEGPEVLHRWIDFLNIQVG